MSSYLGDEWRNFQAQQDRKSAITTQISNFRESLKGAQSGIDAARTDLMTSTRLGEEAFARGREALSGVVPGAERDTASTIRAMSAMVQSFNNTVKQSYKRIGDMRGETLELFRSQVAVQLSDASNAVLLSTSQTMSDTAAEMRAQGVPEAQITNQLAMISADGQRTLGDMRAKIASNESARYATIALETGKWVSDLSQVATNTGAYVLSAAAQEIGAGLRNLSQVRNDTAKAQAGLEQASAEWRSNQSLIRSQIESYAAEMSLKGEAAISELVLAIEEPLLQVGDIMQGMFTLSMGLEDVEYQYNVNDFALRGQIDEAFFHDLSNAFDRLGELNVARHAEGVAATNASQNRTSAIGGAVIQAFATVFGGPIGAAVGAGANAAINAGRQNSASNVGRAGP
jgi:hypothetical protein